MAVRTVTPFLAKISPLLSGRSVFKNMCIVSGASMLGDLGCQTLESFKGDTSFKWDHLRTMRMGITGAFVLMPLSLTWNLYAERLAPGTSWRAVLTKLGISLAVTPPMISAQFTSLTLLEEGKTMSDVHRKLSRDLLPTALNAFCYWPVVSVINTLFVPVISRPAMSSFAGVFWNIYISYQANHNGMEVGELSEVSTIESEAGTVPGTVELLSPGHGGTEVAVEEETRETNSKVKTVSSKKEAEVGGQDGAKGAHRRKKGRVVRRTSVVSV